MKKTSLTLIIAFVLIFSVVAASPVFAANGQPPRGSCPTGFTLHMIEEDHEHMDHHIGLAVDLNADGLICMKVLPNGLHTHMDNVIR